MDERSMARATPSPGPARIDVFSWVAARLPERWTASRRRRRLLFLALAAPGFFAVFATPLHRSVFVMFAGGVLFGAAALFRARTEPLFEQTDRANASLDPDPSTPKPTESPHA